MATSGSASFSELLRQPVEVTGRLARVRSVRLSRRDEQDLVLMYADRADAETRAFDTTGRLLVALARHHPQLISEQLPEVLPWSRFLLEADRRQLAAEFVGVAEACASLGSLAPLAQLLTEWQHTAEVHADPELYRALTRDDLGDHGPVSKPGVS